MAPHVSNGNDEIALLFLEESDLLVRDLDKVMIGEFSGVNMQNGEPVLFSESHEANLEIIVCDDQVGCRVGHGGASPAVEEVAHDPGEGQLAAQVAQLGQAVVEVVVPEGAVVYLALQ